MKKRAGAEMRMLTQQQSAVVVSPTLVVESGVLGCPRRVDYRGRPLAMWNRGRVEAPDHCGSENTHKKNAVGWDKVGVALTWSVCNPIATEH